MRYSVAFVLTAIVVAQTAEQHPTGPRITPPTLNVFSPLGAARGTTGRDPRSTG